MLIGIRTEIIKPGEKFEASIVSIIERFETQRLFLTPETETCFKIKEVQIGYDTYPEFPIGKWGLLGQTIMVRGENVSDKESIFYAAIHGKLDRPERKLGQDRSLKSDKGEIAPGASGLFIVIPQLPFKMSKTVIDNASSFVVNDLSVGKNSQFLSSISIPASIVRKAPLCDMDTAQIGQLITMRVTNIDEANKEFSFQMFGNDVID